MTLAPAAILLAYAARITGCEGTLVMFGDPSFSFAFCDPAFFRRGGWPDHEGPRFRAALFWSPWFSCFFS